jgi:hypothetical protein
MAWVGHTSMHALQVPQWFFTGASIGNGKSVNISPKKNQEPAWRLIRFVCLPIHPRPAFYANGFSNTGALSEKTR